MIPSTELSSIGSDWESLRPLSVARSPCLNLKLPFMSPELAKNLLTLESQFMLTSGSPYWSPSCLASPENSPSGARPPLVRPEPEPGWWEV